MQRSWVQRPVTAGSTSGGGGNQASPQAGACPVSPMRRRACKQRFHFRRARICSASLTSAPLCLSTSARDSLFPTATVAPKTSHVSMGRKLSRFAHAPPYVQTALPQPAHGWFACLFDKLNPYVEHGGARFPLPCSQCRTEIFVRFHGKGIIPFRPCAGARANSASTASARLVCLPL